MRRRVAAVGLSFLDLISCALGGSVMLAVICSMVKDPPSGPVLGEFIFVQCAWRGDGDIGLAFTPPGMEQIAVRQQDSGTLGGAAKGVTCWAADGTGPEQGQRCIFAAVAAPKAGHWKIAPYYVGPGRTRDGTPLTVLKLLCWTRDRTKAWGKDFGGTVATPQAAPETHYAAAPGEAFACTLKIQAAP